MLDNFDLNHIQDIAGARQAILRLLNLVEELVAENRQLREEVQQLRDEINRLKGEQGKPKIKPNQKPAEAPAPNQSSERERRQSKARHKTSKVDQITVDREEVLKKIKYNLRADIRKIRLDYIKKMQNIDELALKKGLFGKKMSVEKLYQKRKSIKKERKLTLAAYEIIETMIENYLTQIDDSRNYIRNQIQDKVR